MANEEVQGLQLPSGAHSRALNTANCPFEHQHMTATRPTTAWPDVLSVSGMPEASRCEGNAHAIVKISAAGCRMSVWAAQKRQKCKWAQGELPNNAAYAYQEVHVWSTLCDLHAASWGQSTLSSNLRKWQVASSCSKRQQQAATTREMGTNQNSVIVA